MIEYLWYVGRRSVNYYLNKDFIIKQYYDKIIKYWEQKQSDKNKIENFSLKISLLHF